MEGRLSGTAPYLPATEVGGAGRSHAAHEVPGVSAKPPTDWESIESHYRAGSLPIHKIGKQFGVSDRDLTAKVQAKVRTELVRSEVRSQSERETVDQAAAIVTLVRGHHA